MMLDGPGVKRWRTSMLPKNIKPGVLDPYQYYSRGNIMPGGVFALEQQYDDNYIFVPLSFTEKLLNYKGKRKSLELLVD